jgi:hypothetical protein
MGGWNARKKIFWNNVKPALREAIAGRLDYPHLPVGVHSGYVIVNAHISVPPVLVC